MSKRISSITESIPKGISIQRSEAYARTTKSPGKILLFISYTLLFFVFLVGAGFGFLYLLNILFT